jgi:hypothetical protein
MFNFIKAWLTTAFFLIGFLIVVCIAVFVLIWTWGELVYYTSSFSKMTQEWILIAAAFSFFTTIITIGALSGPTNET